MDERCLAPSEHSLKGTQIMNCLFYF